MGAEAADEITAETFLVAWRKFDALPSDPLPWLYGVARNMVARSYAASSRDRQTLATLVRERGCPSESSEAADDPRLWAAWGQLSAADREVLALVAWEELSVADAARALACSAPVFSVRLYRARRRLRRLLSDDRSRSPVQPLEA